MVLLTTKTVVVRPDIGKLNGVATALVDIESVPLVGTVKLTG